MRAGIGETESALSPIDFGQTRDHRPGSRLEVERRQTRSTNLGALCARARLRVRFREPWMSCCAAEEIWFFRGKEFRFANV